MASFMDLHIQASGRRVSAGHKAEGDFLHFVVFRVCFFFFFINSICHFYQKVGLLKNSGVGETHLISLIFQRVEWSCR